jgi:hypothetical protein
VPDEEDFYSSETLTRCGSAAMDLQQAIDDGATYDEIAETLSSAFAWTSKPGYSGDEDRKLIEYARQKILAGAAQYLLDRARSGEAHEEQYALLRLFEAERMVTPAQRARADRFNARMQIPAVPAPAASTRPRVR